MNLASVIYLNAVNLGRKPAVISSDEILTYEELWRAIAGVAAFLNERGVQAGDRIGLAMRDHPLHLLAHYSIARLGAIILPIDHRWTLREKQATARNFGARMVLTDGEDIDGVVAVTLPAAATDWHPAGLPPMREDREAPLLISLSSGSTGKPKGALVTHGNMYERFVSQWVAIGLDSRDCFALVTPLFFGAARSFGMSMLAAGGTVHLVPPPLEPEQLVRVLKHPDITACFLPPTLLRRLLPIAERGSGQLLDNLRYLIVSGEPLHPTEAARCRRSLCRNMVGYYASSEGGGVSVLAPADFAEHSATVGIATFRTEVQIVDDEGRQLAPGLVGRLRYRGPGVASRFIDGDGHEWCADDGWCYPGDLAVKFASGHIALRGRDADIIVRGGVNIYPTEVEAALLKLDGIRECAVVGCNDTERGEIVLAFIVCEDRMDDARIEAHCREHLAPYKLPSRFVRLDSMPRSDAGKTDRRALRRLIRNL